MDTGSHPLGSGVGLAGNAVFMLPVLMLELLLLLLLLAVCGCVLEGSHGHGLQWPLMRTRWPHGS